MSLTDVTLTLLGIIDFYRLIDFFFSFFLRTCHCMKGTWSWQLCQLLSCTELQHCFWYLWSSEVVCGEGETEEKKTDLRLNCLQISHDDCCSFLHLTGFYQIQRVWTQKKSAIRSHRWSHWVVDNQRAFLHTDIPITRSRQYQLPAPKGWLTGCCYGTRSVVPSGAPANVLLLVMIDLDNLSFKMYQNLFSYNTLTHLCCKQYA